MNHLLHSFLGLTLAVAGVFTTSAAQVSGSRELPASAVKNQSLKIVPQPVKDGGVDARSGAIPRRKVPGINVPFAQARNSYSLPSQMRFSAPAAKAAGASLGSVRGVVITNSSWDYDNPQYGIYDYPITAGEPVCTPVHVDPERLYILNGVYMGDTFWGAVPTYNSSFQVVKMQFYLFDTATWAVLDEQVGDPSFEALDMTWDATTEKVYACYVDYNNGKCTLGTYNTQYGFYDKTIGTLPEFVSGLAATADGRLFGITTNGKFIEIDKQTAEVTQIGDTGLKPYWASSAAIDQKTGLFYYALELESRSEMYVIDPATAVATKLYDFENNEQIFGMYIHNEDVAPNTPSAVTDLTLDFSGASLEGTVSFSVPATYFDGSAAVGAVDYTVDVDGETALTGTTTFGATVSETLTVTAAGKHTVSVVLPTESAQSRPATVSTWIGGDLPVAVTGAKASWVDGVFTVSWNAVTDGVNGGYIDASAVTYNVTRLPDNVEVATGISETSLTDNVAEPENGVVSYSYSIVAVYDGQASEAAATSKTTLGFIVPPYLNELNSSADITGFKVVDSNGDGKKWGYNSGSGALRIQYNSSKAMDDWFFTPAIQLEAGKSYQFSFKARANSDKTPERIEAAVASGTKPATVIATIIPPIDLVSKDFVTLTGSFIPETSGRYYLGVHAISDKDSYYIYVDDIAVSAGVALVGPAAVSDLTVTPDAGGALTAEISFKAPLLDLAGQTLESLEKIELYRGETLIKTFENPAPGAELSYTDAEAVHGNNTYTVKPYGVYGEGEPTSVTRYVGFDKPVATGQVYAVRGTSAGMASIEWEAVTADVAGNTLPADAVSYNLYLVEGQEATLVAENLKQTSMDYRVCEDTDEQKFVCFSVTASTTAGEGDSEISALVPVGAAYTLPFNESFANGRLSYIWGTLPLSQTCDVMLGQDTSIDGINSYDGDNGLLIFNGTFRNDRACIYTGVIHVDETGNPMLTLYYFNYDCSNTLSVQLTDYTTGDGLEIASVEMDPDAPEGWTRLVVDLSEYAGHDISILLLGTIVDSSTIIIDNITIGNVNNNDLTVRNFSMPGRVAPGVSFNVALTYENTGLQPASGYSVSLYRNNELVETVDGVELAPGVCATVTFEQTADATSARSLEYYAVVNFADDQAQADNTTDRYAVKLVSPESPAIADLVATETGEGVSLQWSEPDLTSLTPTPVTEDLSGFEPFSIGLATSSVFDDYIGGWSMIDRDGLIPYTLTSGGVPVQFANAGKPFGFIVFNGEALGIEGWEAKTGSQMFVSFASGYGANDDWLISPLLPGTAQTVKFYAKSITAAYGNESFEFFSSADLPIVSAFRKIDAVASVPEEWTEYTFTLPEGARYFAIRCTSNGTFAFCVDEITFTPESPYAGLTVVGYNIYRDGEKINDAPVAGAGYIDADAEPGNHIYTVTTVYNAGESEMSNEASVLLSALNTVNTGAVRISALNGRIVIEGAAGENATVAAVDGKLLFNGVLEAKTAIDVPAGVFVVSVAGKTVKVNVK